jgi:PAS domain S-box-containing protein
MQKRIVLVEDDPIQSKIGTEALSLRGYNVVGASTGEKAIEMVESHSDIDLILMDIDLGKGIDGTQAASVILKKRDIPLIFLSSHRERAVVDKTQGITSYGYVLKGSGETVLHASINMAFELFEVNRKLASSLEKINRFTKEKEALFEKMDEGFGIIEMLYENGTAVDYRFIEVNPAFEKQSGIRDVVGKTMRELVPYPYQHWIDIYEKVARTGEAIRFENEYTQQKRFYDVFAFRINDVEKKVGILFKDITQAKKAELEQKEINERLELACNAGNIGIWEYRMADKSLIWNDQMFSIYGRNPTILVVLMMPGNLHFIRTTDKEAKMN